MRVLFVLCLLVFAGCSQSDVKLKRLEDSLEILKHKTDFRPLTRNDAYEFINQYYLPQLDTIPTKRKIFVYALTGKDFKSIYKIHKETLEAEYRGDSVILQVKPYLSPMPTMFNKKMKWDSNKLSNVTVIRDSNKPLENFETFHKKYGYGYMCISYPVYNAYTKKLLIIQWTENFDDCGTGRKREIWYRKISEGWKIDD